MMAIQTVCGEISEKELGATLPHEHLLIDLRSLVDEPKTGKDIFYQKLSLNNRYRVYNDPYTLYDNAVIDELEVAVQEMKLYKEAGGNSVVDVTLDEIGRDPLKLKYISEQSGVNIVMGCGHYTNASLPASVHNATEKELAKEIINDVTVGVRGTGIKAVGVLVKSVRVR
jgi:phosphotriesterase-related protein